MALAGATPAATAFDRGAGGSVTVAICAYTLNRWHNLVAAVDSAVAQLRPGDDCLVVIDHNEELFGRAEAAFAGRASVVRSAGPKGLSGARNTAIAVSRGDILAFLDDDAVALENWLERMRTALAGPDVYAVGSAALPHWPGEGRPSWFPPEFDWVVGCSYVGLPTEPTDVRNVIGAAMAFRREVFDLAGVFSTVVGRIGTAPTGCEETELCIRLRRAKPSARVSYLPDVAVAHHVTPDRLSVRYFFRRCRGEGLSKARVSRLVGASDGLASERSYVQSTLPRGVFREVGRGLRGKRGGFSAAALIVAGTMVTGGAYVRGRLARSERLAAVPVDSYRAPVVNPSTLVSASPGPVDERVSVVIPTHSVKRWSLLRKAVESVQAQSPQPAELVVVVDHNEELYQLACRELAGVTVLANRYARGVSGNRNTGAFHTTSPIVALLDDDARARPGWLSGLLEPFDDAAVVGTGATAVADWESARPTWFPDELLWTVGGSFADAPETRSPIRNVWALAMAVRRDAFEAVGGFQPEFAKVGERSRPEDTDLCLRMSRAGGGQWIYVPDAIVDHLVPRERATVRYLISRCYDEGRGKICMGRRHRGSVDLGPELFYLRRTLPRALGRGLAQTLRGDGLSGLARSASVLGAFLAAAVSGAVEALPMRETRQASPSSAVVPAGGD